LRHGNVVFGHILTGETRRAITVPPQVVQKNPDGSLFVWLIDAARHTAVRQLVEVGALRASEIEIASGLRDGDQVILNVPHTLFEGARLTVANTP
jgi:membrane fusion protein, multidrug efflux system